MTCEQRFQLACESKQEEVIHGRNTINDVKDLTADDVEDVTAAADVEDLGEENAWRRLHNGGGSNGLGINIRANWNSIQRAHWMLTIHFLHSYPVTRQEEDFVMRVLNAYLLENTPWKRLVIGYERCPSTRRFHAHVYLATERTVRMTRSLCSISLRVIPDLREPLRPHINYLDGPSDIINVISEEYVDAIKSGKWGLPEYFLFQNGSHCRQFRDLLVGNQPMKSTTHCRLILILGPVVIFDDPNPEPFRCFAQELKIWGDRYPFIAEAKGRSMKICSEGFVITSNYSLEELTDGDFGENYYMPEEADIDDELHRFYRRLLKYVWFNYYFKGHYTRFEVK
ncbi:hypothetical protein AV274_2957 [Blastocystis sp. ATCC 50177/Nand II]|uniref:Uncharacterized protein n=1 Tax=Blastocystis sp. subtype 1 (strain ATCC 50177 / NandII) TaxID=478820 RepID=A0A196SH89_BLAHN|nr:hypothetical protein AV274_2957 [Blastocystis sp. ATCC 50177/Nand II]